MKTNQLNWKPFAALAVIVGLLFIVMVFGMSFATLGTFDRGYAGPGFVMPWFGWGMGFFWIFPVFGFVMMLVFMFLMMNMVFRTGGPMAEMFGSDTPVKKGPACPSCGRAVEPDWLRCPYCGENLKTH